MCSLSLTSYFPLPTCQATTSSRDESAPHLRTHKTEFSFANMQRPSPRCRCHKKSSTRRSSLPRLPARWHWSGYNLDDLWVWRLISSPCFGLFVFSFVKTENLRLSWDPKLQSNIDYEKYICPVHLFVFFIVKTESSWVRLQYCRQIRYGIYQCKSSRRAHSPAMLRKVWDMASILAFLCFTYVPAWFLRLCTRLPTLAKKSPVQEWDTWVYVYINIMPLFEVIFSQ